MIIVFELLIAVLTQALMAKIGADEAGGCVQRLAIIRLLWQSVRFIFYLFIYILFQNRRPPMDRPVLKINRYRRSKCFA